MLKAAHTHKIFTKGIPQEYHRIAIGINKKARLK